MIIEQYETFLGELGCETGHNPHVHGFQKYYYHLDKLDVPVIVTSEKYKDLYGNIYPLRALEGAKLQIEVAPKKFRSVFYHEVHPIDEHAKPVIVPVLDMTGREISVGKWVTYMAVDPRSNKTGLGIASVNDINTKGELIVTLKMFDGDKKTLREKTSFTISNPKRSIIVPFDASDFMRLILTDFERLGNDPS